MNKKEILKDVSLTIDEHFVAITGPNGGGKSTTASLLMGIKPQTSGTIILDGEDITEQVLADEGYTFLLVAHQLGLANESRIDLINELYDYCLEYGYAFYCLTSSSDEDILKWQEDTGAEYPFCLMDNTTLRTMVRSNPGLILLKKGTVLWKWSVVDIPDEYELAGPLEQLSMGEVDRKPLVNRLLGVFVWFAFPLFLMCMADLAWERYRKRKELPQKEE